MPFCPKCSNSLLNIEPIPIPPILNGKAANPIVNNRQPMNLSGPSLAPLPVMPLLPSQLDGNLSCDSITDSDDHETSENNDNSVPLTPPHHSTPDHRNVAYIDSPPMNDESNIGIPGLLDSLDQTISSVSLDSYPDLDNYLPFTVSQGPHPSPPQHSSALSTSACASPGPGQSNQDINYIPVIIQDRHPPPPPPQRTPQRQTIRRDNRAITALSLPNIMVTNHRSIFPKFRNLVDEIVENEMHLGLHSEIWEDRENLNHSQTVEEALELHGLQYISTPRTNRRGGGAAITLISESPFLLTKLDPIINAKDQSLEICWGLLKPRNPTGQIKFLIVCAFYLPPFSRKKAAIVDHITVNYFSFKSVYQDSAFILGGDKNDLNVQLLLNIDPSFRQIVSKPTYKQSVLDILVTDIGQYYLEPVIRPAVQPDNPASASPSDHKIAFAKANTSSFQPVKRIVKTQTVRPLPADSIAGFGSWVQHESWEFVYNGVDPSDMVSRFNFLVNLNLDLYCPTKVIKISNLDGKISSIAVKQASRKKNREYYRNGNSAKYKELKKLVKTKLKEAATDFLEKQVNLTSSARNSWIRHVKRITARPGDSTSFTFHLPQHIEDSLSALESSNKICAFFSAISQEYSPINIETLPPRVRVKLHNDPCEHPHLADHQVYEGLKKGKKTCSVPGDIPTKILHEFLPELTTPVAAIYREAIATHTWPQPYKKEYHLPISKVPLPKSEDDLRNLGLTPFFSKRLEWFLIQWIWPFIEPHIDPDQLGGLPGCSVEHYLIQMLDFIHMSLDNSSNHPTAVLCALIDFSKAFNRIDHNIIVTILSDLNIPTCALRLVISYLTGRTMCVRHNGATSNEQSTPGGGPQGALLIVLLFNLQVNTAGNPCALKSTLPEGVFGPEPSQPLPGPLPPCHNKGSIKKKKYVDDLSMLERVNLRTHLVPSQRIIGPSNYHETPGLFLPTENSVLQHQLADLWRFTEKNKMKLNIKKTKIIPFNVSKNFDFLPQLHFLAVVPFK